MNEDQRKYTKGTEENYAHRMSFCIHRVAMVGDCICKVGFCMTERADPNIATGFERLPCFNPQVKTCPSAQYPTREDIDKANADFDASMQRMNMIRTAILAALEEHGGKTPKGRSYGSGVIDCPCCKTGKVRFSRSSYNGHVHAACTTEGCASWME